MKETDVNVMKLEKNTIMGICIVVIPFLVGVILGFIIGYKYEQSTHVKCIGEVCI